MHCEGLNENTWRAAYAPQHSMQPGGGPGQGFAGEPPCCPCPHPLKTGRPACDYSALPGVMWRERSKQSQTLDVVACVWGQVGACEIMTTPRLDPRTQQFCPVLARPSACPNSWVELAVTQRQTAHAPNQAAAARSGRVTILYRRYLLPHTASKKRCSLQTSPKLRTPCSSQGWGQPGPWRSLGGQPPQNAPQSACPGPARLIPGWCALQQI